MKASDKLISLKVLLSIIPLSLIFCKKQPAQSKYTIQELKRTHLETSSCFHKTSIPEISAKEAKSGMSDSINHQIEIFVEGMEERFKPLKLIRNHLEDCISGTYMFGWSVNYELPFQNDRVLSIKFRSDFYEDGAVHGLPLEYGLTFDMDKGEAIELSNLIRKPKRVEFLRLFHEELDRLITQEEICVFDTKKRFKFRDIQKYYLAKHGLVIFFNVYEISPYSCGVPQIELTYDRLKGILEMQYKLSIEDS